MLESRSITSSGRLISAEDGARMKITRAAVPASRLAAVPEGGGGAAAAGGGGGGSNSRRDGFNVGVVPAGGFVAAVSRGGLGGAHSIGSLAMAAAAPPRPPAPPVSFFGRARHMVADLASNLLGIGGEDEPFTSTKSVLVTRRAVNEHFAIDASLVAPGDWRGPLAVPRDQPVFAIAARIVQGAGKLMQDTRVGEDVADDQWMLKGEALSALLGTNSTTEQAALIARLAADCKRVVAAQPSLVRPAAPCKVFGDVHGQFRDLLLLFREYGFPNHTTGDVESTTYVFNGDFVDRGAHQAEVVCLLFALKVLYPSRIFLIRGNHEFRNLNENMGRKGFAAHMYVCVCLSESSRRDIDDSSTSRGLAHPISVLE